MVHILWLLIPFYIYLHFLTPAIYGGDSAELITAGVVLGVPHAPGYPVYCLLAKLFSCIVFLGNKAFIINVMSAVIACANAALLFLTLKKINRSYSSSIFGGLAAVGVFIFLPINFEQAVVAEVFGLNLLFFLSLFYLLINDESNEISSPRYYLASLIFGLGMGNHQALLFSLPGLVLLVFLREGREKFLIILKNPFLYVFFGLGLSVYFIMLIRANADPVVNFGDPDTLERLWAVFTRREFGSFELHPTALRTWSADSLGKQAIVYAATWLKEFGYIGIAVMIASLFFLRKQKVFYPLLIVFVLTSPFFIFYSNMSPNTLASWRLERFYLFPGAVLCIFMGMAFSRIESRWIIPGRIAAASAALLMIVSVSRISGTRTNFFFHDFSKNIVRGVDYGGILLLHEILFDEYGSGLAYLTSVLEKRKDIRITARSGTLFKNVYGSDFFDMDGFRRAERRKLVEKKLADKAGNHFYAAVMDKNAVNYLGDFHPAGIVYRKYKDGPSPWFAYIRREIVSCRRQVYDYPTRLILVHYPYFRGKSDLSEIFLKECGHYGSDFEWLQFNIGSVYSREGNLDRAEQYYQEALKLDPFFPDTYFGLGYICLSKGKFATAEQYLKRCLDLKPDYEQAYYNMGFAQYNLGKKAEARTNFEKYLEFAPDSPYRKSIKNLIKW